nr:titin-like protein 1 [Parasacculina yatsui]
MGECRVTHGESNIDLSELAMQPTTISTIAVQCGASRVVIALLKSQEWLELKIVEMKPSFTELGRSLPEAQELERQHNLVLERLADKEMPISELMEQADALISSQQHKADVYAAMAKSLGFAWADLNRQLQTKRRILQLSVQFHRQAENLDRLMDSAETLYAEVLTPNEIHQATNDLEQLDNEKRGILAASLSALQSGNQLIDFLKQIGNDASKDSRTNYLKDITNSACMYVEQYLERLHDRRQYLDCLYISRRALLEHCCALLHLYSSHKSVREKLQKCTANLDEIRSLGDDTEDAEAIQTKIHQLQEEIKKVQRDMLHVLRSADDLARASDNCAGEEPLKLSYQLLDSCSQLVCQADARYQLQTDSVQFFRLSDKAIKALQETAAALPETPSDFSSVKVLEKLQSISLPGLELGKRLLGNVRNGEYHVKGVRDTMEKLEHLCEKLSCSLKEKERSININKEKESLLTSELNEIENWVVQFAQRDNEGRECMAVSLEEIEAFKRKCSKDKHEIELKLDRVSRLQLEFQSELETAAVEHRLEAGQALTQQLLSWKHALEKRMELASSLIEFHLLLPDVKSEVASLGSTVDLASSNHVTEVNDLHYLFQDLQQSCNCFHQTGEKYASMAEKYSGDAKLSTEESVNFVTESISNIKDLVNSLEGKLSRIRSDIRDRERLLTSWAKARESVEKILKNLVTKDEQAGAPSSNTFPDCAAMLTHCQHLSEQLLKHKQQVRQQLHSAEQELKKFADEECIKQEVEDLEERVSSLKDRLNDSSMNHRAFLQAVTTFLKNIENIDRSVSELCSGSDCLSELDTVENTTREMIRLSGEELNSLKSTAETTLPNRLNEPYNHVLSRIHSAKLLDWEAALSSKRDLLVEASRLTMEWQSITDALADLEQQLGQILANVGGNLNETNASIECLKQLKTDSKKTSDRMDEFIGCYSEQIVKMTITSPAHPSPKSQCDKLKQLIAKIDDVGHSLDLIADFYTSVEKSEDWCQTGERLLVAIARQLADVNSQESADNLQMSINHFLQAGIDEQEKRIDHMSSLLLQLEGLVAPRRVETVKQQTQDMVHTLRSIGRELQNRSNDGRVKSQSGGQRPVIDPGVTRHKMVERASQYDAVEKVDASVQPDIVEEIVQSEVISPECCQMKADFEKLSDEELEGSDDIPFPPVFLNQLEECHVTEGESVELFVNVTGLPLPLVTWYHDGVCIDDDSASYNLTYNNGHGLLRINSAKIEHQGAYRCTAENELGFASCETNLSVKASRSEVKGNDPESNGGLPELDSVSAEHALPSIGLMPADMKVPCIFSPLKDLTAGRGEDIKFECGISGTPTPQVIWYCKGQPVPQVGPSHTLQVEGDSHCLILKDVQTCDTGRITVMALNTAGKVKSSCSLQVLEIGRTTGDEQPKVLNPPKLVQARLGEGTSLRVKFSGRPEPSITWMKDGLVLTSDHHIKVEKSCGEAILRLDAIQENHAGTYFCCVENSSGKTDSSIQLSVLPGAKTEKQPVFIRPLEGADCRVGGSVSFECTIEGYSPSEVEWLLNDKPLPPLRASVTNDSNTHTLKLFNTVKMDSGKVTCVARNVEGSNRSEANLRILDDDEEIYENVEQRTPRTPTITPSTVDTSNFLSASSGKKKGYQIIEESVITIQAIKEEQQIGATDDAATEKQRSDECDKLTNQLVQKLVTSSNEEVVDSKIARGVTTLPTQAPKFLSPIQGTVVRENDSFKIEAVFSGRPPPTVEWTKGGKVVHPDPCTSLWHDSSRAKLSVNSAKIEHGGQYTCTLKNEGGTSTSSAEVVVRKISLPPVFDHRLGSQTVVPGRRVLLDATVSGIPAPTVRWLKDNVPVYSSSRIHAKQEGNRLLLVIDCVNVEDAGEYTVEAKNSAGEALSTAELKVEKKQPKTPTPNAEDIDGQFCLGNCEIHHTSVNSVYNYSCFVLLQHAQIVFSLVNESRFCLIQDTDNRYLAHSIVPSYDWKNISNKRDNDNVFDKNLTKSVMRFFVRKFNNDKIGSKSHRHINSEHSFGRDEHHDMKDHYNNMATNLQSGVSKKSGPPENVYSSAKRNIRLQDILSRNDELIKNEIVEISSHHEMIPDFCQSNPKDSCDSSYSEDQTPYISSFESSSIRWQKSHKERSYEFGDCTSQMIERSAVSESSVIFENDGCDGNSIEAVDNRGSFEERKGSSNPAFGKNDQEYGCKLKENTLTSDPRGLHGKEPHIFHINMFCHRRRGDESVLDTSEANVETNVYGEVATNTTLHPDDHITYHEIRLGEPFCLRCHLCCCETTNIAWRCNEQIMEPSQWPCFQQSQHQDGILALYCFSATHDHTANYDCQFQCHHGIYSGRLHVTVI